MGNLSLFLLRFFSRNVEKKFIIKMNLCQHEILSDFKHLVEKTEVLSASHILNTTSGKATR